MDHVGAGSRRDADPVSGLGVTLRGRYQEASGPAGTFTATATVPKGAIEAITCPDGDALIEGPLPGLR